MRLVPLIYGLLTWGLLRSLLVRGFGPELGTGKAVWALLVAYLLWWLPYGMTLRPEPLIVLLAAATLLLAELARQRRSVGALTAATAIAALAVSVSPSGLVAMAPLVLALPWLWAWLREQRTVARVAAVLLLAAAGTSLVPVGFADATLGDFLSPPRCTSGTTTPSPGMRSSPITGRSSACRTPASGPDGLLSCSPSRCSWWSR